MKAITYQQYGGPEVLQLTSLEKPTPGEKEVLVKVHAASLNALDWRMMRASPFFLRLMQGLWKPKNGRLGADMAGTIEAVGPGVTKYTMGDEVFGDILPAGGGAFSEYVRVDEEAVVPKPGNITFEDAASLPVAGLTALQGLRDLGKIRSGQKVLINGASGGVGSFAVQLAKLYDTEVTAICSTGKADMVRSLGADHVIDYTREDFARNEKQYDLIFAANGDRPVSVYKKSLTPEGRYICAGGSMRQLFQAMLLGPWVTIGTRKKTGVVSARMNREDLLYLGGLVASGKLEPMIDRQYKLEEAREAIRYLDEGHVLGKVILTMVNE
ncbi:MAG: NAD(P)-dependent alcohol dehydrogenase [Cyclobacteriaceae bacterium]|nr:NAD(P)-dependent alcohol dehydrogenase [Cyclobacteriaceae bacterium]